MTEPRLTVLAVPEVPELRARGVLFARRLLRHGDGRADATIFSLIADE